MPKGKPSRNADHCRRTALARGGVSLIEILFVVAILGVVAITSVPLYQPNFTSQLQNAAEVVASDLARARSLAVANNSQYELVFRTNGDGYYLQHSGSSPSLEVLPSSAYRERSDTPEQQTTRFSNLPAIDAVQVLGLVRISSSSRQQATSLEFSALGGTTTMPTAEIWLAVGSGSERRYLSITINPTTGLASIGDITGVVPDLGLSVAASTGSSDAGINLGAGS